MSVELILIAVNINLVAFSVFTDIVGQVFTMFVLTVAAGKQLLVSNISCFLS